MTVIFLDKEKADKLTAMGFRYNVQKNDGLDVYVFIKSPSLMKVLAAEFSKNDFYFGKTLNF